MARTTKNSALSPAQTAVLCDARRLLIGQIELAREAPSTGPIATVAATPFGGGYLMGVVDALCQIRGAPFDTVALGIFGAILDEACGRDATTERNEAIEALTADDDEETHYGFADGYRYGGNETLGWNRGACVPSTLVLMARQKSPR